MGKPAYFRHSRLLRLIKRATLALIIAAIAAYLPPQLLAINSSDNLWLTGIVVTLLVCYLGKLLYDTLFYDRYQP